MKSAGLDELQAGIKICRRNINNLKYVDNMTLMAESKEELKNLLIMVKEESEKANLKLNVKQNKTRLWQLHHFMANGKGRGGSSDEFPLVL